MAVKLPATLLAITLLSSTAVHAGSCTDPAHFTARQRIETKFADFVPGQVAVYSNGESRSTVSVLPLFLRSGGIWWRAVSDIGGDLESGLLGEATVDLYAENKSGDVCYGGEVTAAFEYSQAPNLIEISGAGSFVHGLDGGRAGLYMPANPAVGQQWTIEQLDGGATREVARVTSVTSALVKIQITHFEDGVQVEVENKEFDGRGEVRASVPGEPVSRRLSITPLG